MTDWTTPPKIANWYGCVVFALPGEDTTYNHAYSSDPNPDVLTLAPSGAEILEAELHYLGD